MSSTAQTLINRACKWIQAISAGDSPSTLESTDALGELNGILDGWLNEELMCYARQDETFNTVNAQATYSIGPTGSDLVTARPVMIEEAWIIASNITYPVQMITNEQYDAIPYKVASANWPDRANYTATMPNGTMTVYPVPNGAYAFHMRTRVQFTAFATTATVVSLPPGWETALASELAIRLGPMFQRQAPPEIVNLAAVSKRRIRVVNSQPIGLDNELAIAFKKPRSRIISDS